MSLATARHLLDLLRQERLVPEAALQEAERLADEVFGGRVAGADEKSAP